MTRYRLSLLQKFIIAFIILLAAHCYLRINYPDGMQKTLFFADGMDFMGDFFNVVRFVADKNPYFNEDFLGSWPPLPYILLYPFSRLDNYAAMSLEDCWTSMPALISMVFFTVVQCFLFYFSLAALRKKYKVSNMIMIPLMLSGLFIRSVERGNIFIASAACTMSFIAFYDSEVRWKRIAAVIFVSLSAAIKFYPALFSILYLRKKMYREFIYAVILSIMLGILPFLFFEHGFGNIPQIINNLSVFSSKYGDVRDLHYHEPLFNISRYIFRALKIVGMSDTSPLLYDIAMIGGNFMRLLAVFALVRAVFLKDEYISVILIAASVIIFPANSHSYCGIYMFPAAVQYFSCSENHKLHWLFYLAYLSPLQFGIIRKDEPLGTWVMIAFIMVVFMFVNLYQSLKDNRH